MVNVFSQNNGNDKIFFQFEANGNLKKRAWWITKKKIQVHMILMVLMKRTFDGILTLLHIYTKLFWFSLWYLIPLSTIFQLYRCSQFYARFFKLPLASNWKKILSLPLFWEKTFTINYFTWYSIPTSCKLYMES
jgi:hypothetical protein